jgi:hypothetical protein
MRYHWGLGVGHLHAHQPAGASFRTPEEADAQDIIPRECETEEGPGENDADTHIQDSNSDVYGSDDPELGLEDRNLEGWEDFESEGSEGGDMDMEEELFTGM